MGFWKDVKFWIKDTIASSGHSVVMPPDALSKTIKDSSHVRGGAGGVHPTGRGDALDQMSQGADNYKKSFDKKERPR